MYYFFGIAKVYEKFWESKDNRQNSKQKNGKVYTIC